MKVPRVRVAALEATERAGDAIELIGPPFRYVRLPMLGDAGIGRL